MMVNDDSAISDVVSCPGRETGASPPNRRDPTVAARVPG